MNEQQLKERILQRRYQLIVHSYLYYQRGTSLITDATYDRWARELERLQADHPDIAATVPLHNEFKSFDAASGFDLPYGLPWVQRYGDWLVDSKNKSGTHV